MSEQPKSTAGGWKIPFFGKTTGRTAIRSRDANDLVWPLNALGNITIIRTEKSYDEVIYSDANLIIALKKEAQPPNVEGSITIEEMDGTPSVANVTTLKFPNGTVVNPSTGVVEINPGALTIEEVDGGPSVAFDTLIVPNGSLTDNGGGEAQLTFNAGGVSQYRIKSVQGDYYTCRTWDGTTEGGSDVYVAKPYKLRNSITSESIDGVTVSYSYASTVARTATISSVDEDQVIVPRYLSNDIIYVATSNYTGVSVSGTALTLIDMNCDGRAWAKEA